ncbi:unnamed protein product, partial [Prorocentrum cordatum]
VPNRGEMLDKRLKVLGKKRYDRARWATYFTQYGKDFVDAALEDGAEKRIVDIARKVREEGKDLFDRSFVYGNSAEGKGLVPRYASESAPVSGQTKAGIQNSLVKIPGVGRFHAQHG